MKKTRIRLIGILLPLTIFLAAFAVGQTTPALTRNLAKVAIAPDGSRVAWVEWLSTGGAAIYAQSLKSPETKPLRVTAMVEGGNANEIDATWSPDSKQIAFLSDAESPGQLQLFTADVRNGAVRRLTSLRGNVAGPGWSPEGKTIALLYTENAPRAAGPLMPMTPETGVVEAKTYEQRLAIVDLNGNVRQLSPSDTYVYEYDWSPDSKSLAVIAAHGAGDNNWYVAQLYTLALNDGTMRPVHKPPLQIAEPRWSPDGKNIAFIGGLMSDEGVSGGDVFVVPANGGEARDITPGIKASPSWISWMGADKILFVEEADGESGVATVETASGKITSLWSGAEVIADDAWGLSLSVAADHRNSAIIRHSSAHPPEIWAGAIGEWKQISYLNEDVRPQWGEMKSVHWTSDGTPIQGWLVYPTDYDPKQRYPMIVVAHGGPAGTMHNGWPGRFFTTSLLSAHGYFVFYPNPRGSFGQGEAFTRGNVKDFGYGDFRDIMAGVDQILKDLPVDSNRLGVAGWSYGGYMAMWSVTQTHRFAAAVIGAGISNWQSYYGENDIDQWMIPYFGASVYDDPAVYARSSPINFIKNVRTPTLLLVGEHDGECPAPQSREFWHALKTLGVETELVVYPGEGHVFLQPQHREDVMSRLTGWFDHYVKRADGR